jgi:hypothetical protein
MREHIMNGRLRISLNSYYKNIITYLAVLKMQASPGQKIKPQWINKYKYRDRREEQDIASKPIGEQMLLALECFSQGGLPLYSTTTMVAVLAYLHRAPWTDLLRPLQKKLHSTSDIERPQIRAGRKPTC